MTIRTLLMTSRGFWGTALQLLMLYLVLAPLVLWLFPFTSRGDGWVGNFLSALLTGIVSSLAMAHFCKAVTRVVPISEPQSFEVAVRAAASALGYEAVAEGDVIICRPARRLVHPAERVSVRMRGRDAEVAGPNIAVRRLLIGLGSGAPCHSA